MLKVLIRCQDLEAAFGMSHEVVLLACAAGKIHVHQVDGADFIEWTISVGSTGKLTRMLLAHRAQGRP
jgi:hypothetical protein